MAARPGGKEAGVKATSLRTETGCEAGDADELAPHSEVRVSASQVKPGVVSRKSHPLRRAQSASLMDRLSLPAQEGAERASLGDLSGKVIRSEPPGTAVSGRSLVRRLTVSSVALAKEEPVRRVVWGPVANHYRLPD